MRGDGVGERDDTPRHRRAAAHPDAGCADAVIPASGRAVQPVAEARAGADLAEVASVRARPVPRVDRMAGPYPLSRGQRVRERRGHPRRRSPVCVLAEAAS